jgi:hypothetical protein
MPWTPKPFDYYGTASNQVLEDLEQANDNFEILGNCFVNDDPTTGKAKEADTVDGFHASQTPAPNTIPVADAKGKISTDWLNLSQTSTPNAILVADANGKIDTGWINASAKPLANQIPILDANANLILPNTSLIQTNTYTFRRVVLSNATSDYPLAVGEEAIINFTNATSVPLRIATQDGTVYEMHLIPSNTGGTSGGGVNNNFLNPNNTTYSNAFKAAEIDRNTSELLHSCNTYNAFKIGFAYTSAFCIITNRTVCKNIKGFYEVYGVSSSFPAITVISTGWQDTTTAWTSLGTITFPQSTSGQILVRRIL